MKKVSNWIVYLAASIGHLSAAWNPSVDIAVPPISYESGGTTGPVLTVNSLNNGIGVWQGRPPEGPPSGGDDFIYASSYTFGSGWGPPVVISDQTQVQTQLGPFYIYRNQGDPDVMMNDSGYAVAVWEGELVLPDPDLYFRVIVSSSRSSDGTWSPVQILQINDQDESSVYPQNTSVAVNEAGLAVAMWNEEADFLPSSFIRASFLPQGSVWTTPVILDGPNEIDSQNIAGDVEINDNGNAVAIWQSSSSTPVYTEVVRAATYDPATSLWTTVTLDPDYQNFTESNPPEVAIDSNGNAVAIWIRQVTTIDDTGQEVAAAYYTNGSGWGPMVVLDSTFTASYSGPYVVMDPFGTATAIWGNINNQEVFSSRLPLGGTWSAPTLVASGSFDAFDPYSVQEAASVDAQGNVVIIIEDSNGNLQSVLRTVQGGWQVPENIFSDERFVSFPNIGLGSCGFALAFWRDGSDFDQDAIIQGSENFLLANYLLAPANFVGSRCCQKFASQKACLVNLSWDPVDCAIFYYIRRNGELIATIPAGGSTSYVDPVCRKNQSSTYTLSAVNIYGIESPGVTITVP